MDNLHRLWKSSWRKYRKCQEMAVRWRSRKTHFKCKEPSKQRSLWQRIQLPRLHSCRVWSREMPLIPSLSSLRGKMWASRAAALVCIRDLHTHSSAHALLLRLHPKLLSNTQSHFSLLHAQLLGHLPAHIIPQEWGRLKGLSCLLPMALKTHSCCGASRIFHTLWSLYLASSVFYLNHTYICLHTGNSLMFSNCNICIFV